MLMFSGSARDPATGISANQALQPSGEHMHPAAAALIPSPVLELWKRFSIDVGASVGVDFQTDSDLDDNRGFPLHGRFLGFDALPSQSRSAAERCQPTAAADILAPGGRRQRQAAAMARGHDARGQRDITRIFSINRTLPLPPGTRRLIAPHGVERADHPGRRDGAKLTARVRDRADDRADNRRPLADTIGPGRLEIALVIVDPLFAPH